jgi:hypothetical protein
LSLEQQMASLPGSRLAPRTAGNWHFGSPHPI